MILLSLGDNNRGGHCDQYEEDEHVVEKLHCSTSLCLMMSTCKLNNLLHASRLCQDLRVPLLQWCQYLLCCCQQHVFISECVSSVSAGVMSWLHGFTVMLGLSLHLSYCIVANHETRIYLNIILFHRLIPSSHLFR